ncbi:sugar transferase [Porphyromonas somerae]|uniref:sugar transferase n=1 Tax=Porphyromonas somerae TaxID=322095 RepID=UPI002A839F6F|nr:sugar transferase [Porphyromonas somerae]MDY3885112.1 sugar transferase [Porphyromonas somerae]MDY5814718.1 sugar transferase [Porphyromonas somerae]
MITWTSLENEREEGNRIKGDRAVSLSCPAREAEVEESTVSSRPTLGYRAVKRFSDIVIALGGLLVFGLPILVIAFLVWCEDKHSPIFKQERIGKGGKPFTLYKFRSMRIDAEKGGRPQLCATEGQDPRLTKVGAFIRNHHLDEFPQLWNILRGDMSFVGYRPERQFFIDQIMETDSRYEELYEMRPGVFSEATLYNGYTDTLAKMLHRLEMDLDYIKSPSLMRDLSIIWKTTLSILSFKKF